MGNPIIIKPSLLMFAVLMCGITCNPLHAQTKKSKLERVMVLNMGAGPGELESCDHLNASLRELGTVNGFSVDVLAPSDDRDVAFSAENLAKYQVVILAYNNGVHRFIQGAARNDFEKYVEKGGGLLAIHTASAFISGWPWIDSVLVQKFYGPHQAFGPAADLKQDAEGLGSGTETRGIAKDLAAPDGFIDAFVQFQATPRGTPDVTILLTVDEASSNQVFNAPMGLEHPVAWAKTIGKGRVVHNSLGFSFAGRNHNAYTQKGNYLKNFTYTSLRYAAGDFVGCMDNAFAEYNPDATKSDPAQCATPATARLRFDADPKRGIGPMVSQSESGTLVNVEFFRPGPNAVAITDVAGKRVYLKTGSGPLLYSVPIPKRSGIYVVKAESGGKVSTHRVTVL